MIEFIRGRLPVTILGIRVVVPSNIAKHFQAHARLVKVHVEIFDDAFPGEAPDGAALVVQKVRAAINIRFQGGGSKPGYVFVDRGRGFYHPATGKITNEFKEALEENGLKAVMGNDASVQPGHMQEVLLHETSVSWLRVRLAESLPAEAWLETRQEYGTRLKRCCDAVNRDLDVEGLCRGFVKRIKTLHSLEGGRLKK